MAKNLSIKNQAKSLVDGNGKERAIYLVEETIWLLASFTQNNKVILTSFGNAHQIKNWVSVLIEINKLK